MPYQLEGDLLEVCTCKVICPCWVGEDPDGGACEGVVAYHLSKGRVNGVDVSGRTFVLLAHIPGNVLKGNWRVVVYVDDKATPQQQAGLLDAFTGKLGGPLAGQGPPSGHGRPGERAEPRVQRGPQESQRDPGAFPLRGLTRHVGRERPEALDAARDRADRARVACPVGLGQLAPRAGPHAPPP